MNYNLNNLFSGLASPR